MFFGGLTRSLSRRAAPTTIVVSRRQPFASLLQGHLQNLRKMQCAALGGLADLLLTPSDDADANLRSEGVPAAKIHLVGNIMIDTLLRYLPFATLDLVADRARVQKNQYAVLTLHRPSNVDEPHTFRQILAALEQIGKTMPIVFPVHPRTRERIRSFGFGKGRLVRAVVGRRPDRPDP